MSEIADEEVPAEPRTRRERAVARSLDTARERANARVERYLEAALELLQADPSREFTVQEVVERSGQSLRGFYQYFAGKHELLLALFEESVRTTAQHLRDAIAEVDDPLERLHRVIVEYYRLCRPDGQADQIRPPVALADFAQRLLTSHPTEASQAFTPLETLVEDLLADAVAAGVVRADLPRDRVAGVMLEAVMFNAFTTTISGSRSSAGDAEVLWELLFHGVTGGADAGRK